MRTSPLKKGKPLERKTSLKAKPQVKSKSASRGKSKKEKVPSVAVLDSLFSQYIRRNEECQLWGFGGIPCSVQLQCSHIHSRRFHSVRWDKGNAICACAAHHRWQHDHPHLSTWALEDILGREHLEALNERWLSGKKPTPDQKRAIAAELREDLRRAA